MDVLLTLIGYIGIEMFDVKNGFVINHYGIIMIGMKLVSKAFDKPIKIAIQ